MHSYRPARFNNSGEQFKVLVNNAKRLVCNDRSADKISNVDAIPGAVGGTQTRQVSSAIATTYRGFFTNQPSRDLKRFLEEVGTDAKEARYWLRHFQELEMKPDEPFAVVEIASAVFNDQDMLERLVSCLAFLHRNGMNTVLIHGIDQTIGKPNIGILDKQKKQQLMDENIKLVDMLENSGVKARPFLCSSHMISASISSNRNEMGVIEHVDTKHLRWCLSSGHTPVLTAVGETHEGQVVYTDPTSTAIKIASILQPTKVIFLNSSGGLVDNKGEVIDCINVPGGINPVVLQPWINKASSNLVTSISNLLLKMPQATSAVITSADSLIKELFTHCGSGTLLQTSEPINVYHSLEGVDVDKLTELLVRSFDKTLNEDYFLTLKERLHTLYVTESYTAAALLTSPNQTSRVPYLDKFTISKESQGLGTSDNLWKEIMKDCPQLCWRSRRTNRINPWYFVRSCGSWQNGEWIIFWYGVSDPLIAQQIVEYTSSLPSSFDPIAPHDEIKSKKVFSTSAYHKYL